MAANSINFFFEEVPIPDFFHEDKIRDWLFLLGSHHGVAIDILNYILCSDEYLLDINKTYLDHDYYTDIITFPYQQGVTLESDIFISLDRVKENAFNLDIENAQEFLRVVAHGFLHLVGFGDKSTEEAEIMRQKEDEALSFYTFGK